MDELGGIRVGDGERQETVEALTVHREVGRLDPTEFEERQVAASRARTWAEIGPLFSDLPEPHPAGMPAGLAVMPSASAGSPSAGAPAPLPAAGLPAEPAPAVLDNLVPRRYRDTIMALMPLAAVVLFFKTGSWLWFLGIPIVAILLYGPDGNKNKKERRCR